MAYTRKTRKTQGKKKSPWKKVAPVGKALRYAPSVLSNANKLASLSRDVMIMKGLTSSIMGGLNVEKKHKDVDVINGHFGQVNNNANGIYMIDVTPSITQGLDSDERIGNSLKLTGMSFPIQFSGMEKTISARKIKVMLFKVTAADNGVNLTECINDYLDVNPINNILDMNSPRAYRKHTHDGIKLIRSKTYTLPKASHVEFGNDDHVSDEEKSSFMAKFNVKLNDILRFHSSVDTKPDGTRYYMYFLADKGNVGNTTSMLDVPIQWIDTGVGFKLGQRSWWVDN